MYTTFPTVGQEPSHAPTLYSKKVGNIVVSAMCSQIIFGLSMWIQGRAKKG